MLNITGKKKGKKASFPQGKLSKTFCGKVAWLSQKKVHFFGIARFVIDKEM
eukprot:c43082_g1_i1 orf=1-153(+)